MGEKSSSFAVHVWRRVEGEERLLGAQAPDGSPPWIAAAPGLIRPQVAHGACRAEALGNLVLALASVRRGLVPALRIQDGRLLAVPDPGKVGERSATDDEVATLLAAR